MNQPHLGVLISSDNLGNINDQFLLLIAVNCLLLGIVMDGVKAVIDNQDLAVNEFDLANLLIDQPRHVLVRVRFVCLLALVPEQSQKIIFLANQTVDIAHNLAAADLRLLRLRRKAR